MEYTQSKSMHQSHLNGSAGAHEHFPSLTDRAKASTKQMCKNGAVSPTHSAHGNFFLSAIAKPSVVERRARKVLFYRNGDQFFQGMVYAITQEKFRTFESLLSDLSSSAFCDRTILPKGVRHIFALNDFTKISSLEQLEDGESYICCSVPCVKRIDYPKSSNPSWNVDPKNMDRLANSITRRQEENNQSFHVEEDREYIKPKLVTVIRNGIKPRKAVRVLLNRKTAHSFDQVMNDITEAIKLDSGVVKKLYSLNGKQVTSLQDFFTEETVFIAYGTEKHSADDFELGNEEIQFTSSYQRCGRQQQRIALKSPKARRRLAASTVNGSMTNGELYQEQKPTRPQSHSPHSSRRGSSDFQPKSPILSRYAYTNGHSDGEELEPPSLRVKYKIGKVIGEGNFAVVKECVEKARKKQFALKIINKSKCQDREDMIKNEVRILKRLKHHNIVQLIEEFDTPNNLYLVMELVTGGDLFDAICSATRYTERDASGMLFNMAQAIGYLHSLSIVHRDIKPENLLVHEMGDGTKLLKLGDFGLATVVKEPLYVVCGTPTYVAPEVLTEQGYDVKIDVWSVGVITYILLCGSAPFVSETNNQDELFEKIISGKVTFQSKHWQQISSLAKELIMHMLQVDPGTRITAAEILQHPWVAEDAANDSDLCMSVGHKIAEFVKTTSKPKTKPPGVTIVTFTALDKGSRYFQGRRHLQHQPEAGDEVF